VINVSFRGKFVKKLNLTQPIVCGIFVLPNKMQNLWLYLVVNIIIKLCWCAKESFVLQFPLKKSNVKKFPGFERFLKFSVTQNLSFLSLFSNWTYPFYYFFFSGCKLCMLKTKYLEKHNKRQNVTGAHSFLLFHKKTP
jgi:hypothetical protein